MKNSALKMVFNSNKKRISTSLIVLIIVLSLLSACQKENNGQNDQADKNPSDVTDTEKQDGGNKESATYPISIKHAFGETVIKSEPTRIATISWGNQDIPLALGIIPVGVSKSNFGGVDENGLLPWTTQAYKDLNTQDIVVFDDTDGLDYEAISDAKPDVILAAYSGIKQEEYDLLTQIAPVIAYPEYPWQTYWREQTLVNAKGMGKEEQAKALIAETEELIKTKLEEYENLKGKTAAFFYFNASDLGNFYIYILTDPRASYLEDLGLKFPESVKKLAGDKRDFTITMSAENIDVLNDIDIIITYGDDSVLDILQADSLVGQIPAISRGSVVMLDPQSALAASCTPTPLSIKATIDEYLQKISEAAEKVQ